VQILFSKEGTLSWKGWKEFFENYPIKALDKGDLVLIIFG
jgi:hypothetical protein